MALKVTQTEVWAASIQDKPGGMAEKLEALAKAGAALDFVIARRSPDKPGTGVLFVAPLKGDKAVQAAKAAGFAKSDSLHSVRLEGLDQAGIGARLTHQLAEADINLRGLSAAAIGDRFVCYLALDSADDAAKAAELLQKF
jgi:hypothetical protein